MFTWAGFQSLVLKLKRFTPTWCVRPGLINLFMHWTLQGHLIFLQGIIVDKLEISTSIKSLAPFKYACLFVVRYLNANKHPTSPGWSPFFISSPVISGSCSQNVKNEKYALSFTYFKSHSDWMHDSLLNRMLCKIELIKFLCSGEWQSLVFIPGQEIDTNTVSGAWLWFHIPPWQYPDQLCFCCSFCCCMCETRQTQNKTFNALWVLGSHIWEHKGLRPSHIPSLHSWLKVIPPGWGELKYQFVRNAIEEASKFTHQGEDKSHPCPAMWGPLAESMNTIEGLFLAEQAMGRPDDKWLLDSRERTVGPLKGHEDIKSVHYGLLF